MNFLNEFPLFDIYVKSSVSEINRRPVLITIQLDLLGATWAPPNDAPDLTYEDCDFLFFLWIFFFLSFFNDTFW